MVQVLEEAAVVADAEAVAGVVAAVVAVDPHQVHRAERRRQSRRNIK